MLISWSLSLVCSCASLDSWSLSFLGRSDSASYFSIGVLELQTHIFLNPALHGFWDLSSSPHACHQWMTKEKTIWQSSISICFVTIFFELKYSLLKGGGRLIKLKLNPQVSRSSWSLQDSQVILHITSLGSINSNNWWWTGDSLMERPVKNAGSSREATFLNLYPC